jgi:hypothetical protein
MDPEYGDAEVTPEIGDNYLSAELMLPNGGVMVKGRVTAHKRDWDSNPVGRANDNPILDTRLYIVDFDDGDHTELTANMIAESLYSQCDPDGNQYVLLDEIVNHQRLPTAIKLSDQKIVRADAKTYLKRSTNGWQLCCQWKDGSTSWENLADLKESHPIEIAKYAKILGIDHEPAFNWWVPHNVLRKNLAGNVGDMLPTCCRHVKMSPIFAQNACQCRHQNSPDTEFHVGFLATLYHIPRS